MTERKGEKMGWIGGWFGSFLWFLVLSVLWVVRGKVLAGLLGLGLFVLAGILIFLLAPWRYPQTRYWKLMLPLYVLLIGAAVFCVGIEGGFKAAGLDWFLLLWILPVMMPLVSLGRRCWKSDGA
jgi:hypothetical protein